MQVAGGRSGAGAGTDGGAIALNCRAPPLTFGADPVFFCPAAGETPEESTFRRNKKRRDGGFVLGVWIASFCPYFKKKKAFQLRYALVFRADRSTALPKSKI